MLRRISVVMLAVTVVFLMACPSYAFRDSIVAAWTLDEGSGTDIHDISGNSNDGNLIGGAEWADGKFGKALDFDGTSGYIEIPFDDSINLLNAGDFTLAAWFMPDEIPVEYKAVLQQGDNDGPGRTWLLVHETNEFRSSLGGSATQAGIGVEAKQWYHAAVVVTEAGGTDSVQIYVNGEAVGAAGAKGMEDSAGPYFIGCHKSFSHFWDGIIDEVVMFNKALNEAEIRDLMDNGIANIMAVEPTDKLAVSWGSVKDL